MQLTARCHRARLNRPEEVGLVPLAHYSARFGEWGQGQPLVLVPGLAGGLGLVGPIAVSLAERFHVHAYELRGEDDCFSVRTHFGWRELIEDLKELLDHLGLERPILCGVSFGGVLALQFAAAYPHRLGGLIIQGADVRFQRSLIRQVAGHVLTGYPLPSNSAFINQFFNLLIGGRPQNRMLPEFVAAQCWQTDQGVIAHRFRLVERLNLTESLEAIRVPALLVNGDRDVLVSESGVQQLRRSLRQAEFVSMTGAGHLAFVTHPQELAARVFDFAGRHRMMSDC